MVRSLSTSRNRNKVRAASARQPQGRGARQDPARNRPAPSQASAARKWVYTFGDGKAEGQRRHAQPARRQGRQPRRDGAISACRCRPASPSPPRSAPTTTHNGKTYPTELEAQVEAGARAGRRHRPARRFGDPQQPAAGLGALRRARLDAGHDGHRAQSRPQRRRRSRRWPKTSGDARFAYDSYRRFIQMYSDVVLGVEHHQFEEHPRRAQGPQRLHARHRSRPPTTGSSWSARYKEQRRGGASASRSRRTRRSSSGARSARCSARG